MLKMCVALFRFVKHKNQDSGNKKDVRGAPMSVDFSQSRDIYVRIVHAGGKEELYRNVVPVSHLMKKHPGMCITRTEVFTNPDESLLRPGDRLLPGQKYYIIPSSTVQKLKSRHRKKLQVKRAAEGREERPDARITRDISGENLEESVYSAKDFYVAKPSKASKVPKEKESKHSGRKGRGVKKPFVPPLPRASMLRESGWEPSLTSIQELSP
ncbi:uncharacterized protein LOC120171106 [Hibiscus syriacus]|uniref:uncharacterized protein LOC120171106 n=1 Tax=Hibiscus syriacus TaxID=106335 RepID=UPI001923A361|nr:uncharacterized protein LOC120171106 [Hibiscus syriacus]